MSDIKPPWELDAEIKRLREQNAKQQERIDRLEDALRQIYSLLSAPHTDTLRAWQIAKREIKKEEERHA